MDSPREQACPSCSAPAEPSQRWCLECGAELPQGRMRGLRPLVGLATALLVLVGAASAGGYSLLQDSREPPPPATTVAQAPPPATTPPVATLPPATQEPPPLTPTDPPTSLGGSGGGTAGGAGAGSAGGSSSHGAARDREDEGEDEQRQDEEPEEEPRRFGVVDIAVGSPAIAYAPDAAPDVDLGDPSLLNDGTTRTAWRTPAQADATAHPQMGVYLELAAREPLRRIELRTPTPGISIEVYGAQSGPPAAITAPGWDHLASRAALERATTIRLPRGAYRYVLVWIAGLPPGGDHAAIAELRVFSRQPL